MLTRVHIRNFQSLVDVDLALERFTVIVGPSNSGKSALVRALAAAAGNPRRGGAYITRGQKNTTVAVHTDTHLVVFERAAGTSGYRVLDLATGTEQSFARLAGTVPDQVSAALRLPADGGVNLAGQFAPPYLLTESGSAVARVLGALTNVTTIFAAAAEAVRRRNTHAATLRTRQTDLTKLREQARRFADLPARLAACARAEEHADNAARLGDRIARLRRDLDTVTVAQGVLRRTAPARAVPADTAMLAAQARLDAFRTLVRGWVGAQQREAAATAAADQAAAREQALTGQLHDTLHAAGHCPLCGRDFTP